MPESLSGPLLLDAETFTLIPSGGQSLRTITLIFEFAAAVTQQYTCPQPGYLLGVLCSTANCAVQINAIPISPPNGGVTRVLTDLVWGSGLSNTTGQWLVRAKFNLGDIIYVRMLASGLTSVVIGYVE